jgi:hypothetical protein
MQYLILVQEKKFKRSCEHTTTDSTTEIELTSNYGVAGHCGHLVHDPGTFYYIKLCSIVTINIV